MAAPIRLTFPDEIHLMIAELGVASFEGPRAVLTRLVLASHAATFPDGVARPAVTTRATRRLAARAEAAEAARQADNAARNKAFADRMDAEHAAEMAANARTNADRQAASNAAVIALLDD